MNGDASFHTMFQKVLSRVLEGVALKNVSVGTPPDLRPSPLFFYNSPVL